MSACTPFTDALIAWQKAAGRHDLPWQKTRDPYRIWLSEIMLQQTQVTTVIPYYQRFLARFPDVESLAAAPIEEVIALWAGLGYYARARNLHRCAQEVAGGTVTGKTKNWPKSKSGLEALPGIGRSTAAAIAAFAFGERAAILDGNVKRVLCRQFGVEGFPGAKAVHDRLWDLAERLLPETDIEAYTQGLMDLGATVCTRSRPRCGECPVSAGCVAMRTGRQAELPASKPKAAVPERQATFVVVSDGSRVLLQRRPPSGIWGGLLVPPEGQPADVLAALGLTATEQTPLAPFRHTFTHFKLTLAPVLCRVDAAVLPAAPPGPEWAWVALAHAADAGVPAPIARLLRQVASAGD